jgi:2-dehydropantoate 2-reductase
MRILVVGAGATGGYFGGRLLEANRDVTFLVRPRRAAELAQRGLLIRSPFGDAILANPPAILSDGLRDTFDLVLLSCKAYDLEGAMKSFAPAVGPDTMILPLLNGMRHLDTLDQRFGRERVLGGVCIIAATLNDGHEIVHLNDQHALVFGERDGTMSERIKSAARLMEGARFEVRANSEILLEMWEKWVFLASLAASNCLMRAAVGDILESPGGTELVLGLLEECRAVAAAEGYAPREAALQRMHGVLTAPGSTMTASTLRDMERNGPIEADHIIGDLLRRGSGLPLLQMAYTHLKAYEARRKRMPAAPPTPSLPESSLHMSPAAE